MSLSVDFFFKTIDVIKKEKLPQCKKYTENLSTAIFLWKYKRIFANHPVHSEQKKHITRNISTHKKRNKIFMFNYLWFECFFILY